MQLTVYCVQESAQTQSNRKRQIKEESPET